MIRYEISGPVFIGFDWWANRYQSRLLYVNYLIESFTLVLNTLRAGDDPLLYFTEILKDELRAEFIKNYTMERVFPHTMRARVYFLEEGMCVIIIRHLVNRHEWAREGF